MTVYFLDWEHGDDTADGLTPDTAFLTAGRVYDALKGSTPEVQLFATKYRGGGDAMNRQDFEEQYAQRSGYATAAEYFQEMKHEGMECISLPCHCGDDGCQGWQMRSLATIIDYDLQFIPEPYRAKVRAAMISRPAMTEAEGM